MQNFYQSGSYRNVMETLVEEEIDRQISNFSSEQRFDINRIDVATYALNRLRPLYVSSQEGWIYQKQRGQKQGHKQIKAAVHQALTTISKNPARFSTPLRPIEEIEAEAEMARMTLRDITGALG